MKYRTIYFGLSLFLLALTSCQSEFQNNYAQFQDREIGFEGTILNGSEQQTRALTQLPLPITGDNFDVNFYIEKLPEITDAQSEYATYYVPQGYSGLLYYKEGTTLPKLNWTITPSPGADPTTEIEHNFWSWTAPWKDSSYVPSADTLQFTLKDSYLEEFTDNGGEWPEGSWQNGSLMEKLIGAQAGPYNFRNQGVNVPLQFRHLMSKIVVDSFTFIASDGSQHNDIYADIMFVNMPRTFTLYPHPSENGTPGADNALMVKDGPPIVVTNSASADKNGGITFAITKPDHDRQIPEEEWQYDEFYICPEIDFSNVEFKVTIAPSDKYSYEDRGEYWGNFSVVGFDRDGETDYDTPGGGDSKILHAGEEMHMYLVVKQNGGAGTTMYIRDWNTYGPYNTIHHTHKGIYENGEARDINGTTADNMEGKFENMGDGTTEGEPQYWTEEDKINGTQNPYWEVTPPRGIFHLYDDVLMSGMTFYIRGNYLLDGMGYTVTMTQNSTTLATTITIGNMRDVYIKLDKSDYQIYIDKNGYIHWYDAESEVWVDTLYQIDGSKESYSLDLSDPSKWK